MLVRGKKRWGWRRWGRLREDETPRRAREATRPQGNNKALTFVGLYPRTKLVEKDIDTVDAETCWVDLDKDKNVVGITVIYQTKWEFERSSGYQQ